MICTVCTHCSFELTQISTSIYLGFPHTEGTASVICALFMFSCFTCPYQSLGQIVILCYVIILSNFRYST